MNIILLVFAALFISYFNGSNDNIKGVATLYASRVTDYRKTILWGSFTTFIGSLFALIVALFIFFNFVDPKFSLLGVSLAMMIGGLINSRRVAETMSKKITPLNHGQGFTANFTKGLLVIASSFWGLPVSTTHVSVGSLFGIGLITKESNKKVVNDILYSWILTLPVAAIFGGIIYLVLSHI